MDKIKILAMCRARLDRQYSNLIDDQLMGRIEACEAELARRGIHLQDTPDDTMLLVDYVVFRYGARDKQTGEPEWLRIAIRERWLNDRAGGEA